MSKKKSFSQDNIKSQFDGIGKLNPEKKLERVVPQSEPDPVKEEPVYKRFTWDADVRLVEQMKEIAVLRRKKVKDLMNEILGDYVEEFWASKGPEAKAAMEALRKLEK